MVRGVWNSLHNNLRTISGLDRNRRDGARILPKGCIRTENKRKDKERERKEEKKKNKCLKKRHGKK